MSTTTAAVVPLTIEDAEALVTVARRAAEVAGVRGSVTVLDAGGHLLAFRRDDQAVLISGETAPARPTRHSNWTPPPRISSRRSSRAASSTPCPPRSTARSCSSRAASRCTATAA